MFCFSEEYWSLIIGGSSGFGLAAARKLARHGMNICIVHRDRKGAMKTIQPQFDAIRSTGVRLLTVNTDALNKESREKVLDDLAEEMGGKGRIRMVLHSIAFGNLKLLAPHYGSEKNASVRRQLSAALSVSDNMLSRHVERLYGDGATSLIGLMDNPSYNNRQLLDGEDFSRTIQAMGFNIVEWVQDLFGRHMLAGDARVLSLTSEGNRIAWRGYAAVSAAKAVLESAARSMAVELAPYGIRSNIIQAGVTDTAALRAIPGNRQIRAKAMERNPFGRLTRPEDVADVIFLLCLDEAAWMNGSLLRVDGGESIA